MGKTVAVIGLGLLGSALDERLDRADYSRRLMG